MQRPSSVARLIACAAFVRHDVIGVHMRNWDASDEHGEEVCTETDDLKYARAVCEQLEIPLKQVSRRGLDQDGIMRDLRNCLAGGPC